ncbi:LOW QUALITY PROTEIN: general transcription factor 3C polypeptide 5-like [Geothlypis trichas]
MAAARQRGPRGSAVLELPRKPRLVCVEYPGLVQDVGAMLRTLGVEQGVSRDLCDPAKRLELYFRPKDPYCHPVCANRFPTSTMLLRVRRRSRKKQQLDPEEQIQPEVQFEMEILGIVTTVYKFQGMSDFQYLAMHSGPDGKQTSMYDKVLMLKPEEEFFNKDLPLYIPPPIFSRLDTPVDYFYRPDIQHREGYNNPQVSGENLIGLSRARRPHNAIFVNFDDEEVPTKPWMLLFRTGRNSWVRPVSRNAVKANISVHPDA